MTASATDWFSSVADHLRRALVAILPPRVRAFGRRYLELESGARKIFLARALRRLPGSRRPRGIDRPAGTYRAVVCVCHGNILRSPFAEALLRRKLAESGDGDIAVSSAGLHAKPGREADSRGIEAARAMGLDLNGHRATRLTADIVRMADAIVVMDFGNEAECLAHFPEAATKLLLLGEFDPERGRRSVEIDDPYSSDSAAVRLCYDQVARSVVAFHAWLTTPRVRSETAVRAPTARRLAR